jgi:hypothetical protein
MTIGKETAENKMPHRLKFMHVFPPLLFMPQPIDRFPVLLAAHSSTANSRRIDRSDLTRRQVPIWSMMMAAPFPGDSRAFDLLAACF